MLTGKCSFEANTSLKLIRLHVSGHPPAIDASAPGAICMRVQRLMEKMDEDRFSSAKSVLLDLESMAIKLQSDSRSHSVYFNTSNRMILPKKLHGRDIECTILSAALDKSCAGTFEVTLINGPAGCGKSKLASSASELVSNKGGYFISGEFDHPHRGNPYSAI